MAGSKKCQKRVREKRLDKTGLLPEHHKALRYWVYVKLALVLNTGYKLS